MGSPHRVRALPGGARLVTESMPERHSTSVVFMFAGGSRLEDERLAGVSHFIEHLYFKGTRRRPSSKEIADAIEGVGGFINASTDKELTAYWARVPSERMELGFDVLFDIVANSRLDEADVEKERMVILDELRMYQDQPQELVQNLFEELIWPGHPLGRDIAGTEASVSRLTRDDILEYADAHYRLPNLVIGAAGSLDMAGTVDMVARGLSLRADPDGAISPSPPAPLDSPRVLVRRRDTEQAHVCLGAGARERVHQRTPPPGAGDDQRRGVLADLSAAPARLDQVHRRGTFAGGRGHRRGRAAGGEAGAERSDADVCGRTVSTRFRLPARDRGLTAAGATRA